MLLSRKNEIELNKINLFSDMTELDNKRIVKFIIIGRYINMFLNCKLKFWKNI